MPTSPPYTKSLSYRYDSSGAEGLAVPFHETCFTLFGKSLAPRHVDVVTLYEAFKSLSGESPWLDMDYGSVKDMLEQYWWGAKGAEEFVFHPVSIPWLQEYYASLPAKKHSGKPRAALRSPANSNQDPLSHLNLELISQIMYHADVKDVQNFRLASRFAAQIALDDAFWKRRLLKDMPWLFDFPVNPVSKGAPAPIGWAEVYRELFRRSDTAHADRVLGLVNRRRIWGLCNTISEVYMSKELQAKELQAKKAKKSKLGGASRALAGAKSTPLSLLVLPDPKDLTSTQEALLYDYQELLGAKPVLLVSWTKDGHLADIECDSYHGTSSDREQYVKVPRDDWITGVVITSESKQERRNDTVYRSVVGLRILFAGQDDVCLGRVEGDQRLIEVTGGQFVVGFACQRTRTGELARLALLKQPKTKIPKAAKDRVKDRRAVSYNGQVAKYLWGGEIPPVPLRPSPLSHGYWSHDLKIATSTVDALVFGSCEEELSDITAIGADVNFGGFEVQYATRPPRFSGPARCAMQYLKLDGSGGERVVRMYWSVNHIPTSLRLVTNRGRQLVVGHPPSTETRETRYPGVEPKEKDCAVAGMFCYWSSRQLPEATLQGVGALYLPEQPKQPGSTVGSLTDASDFHWTPEPPPTSLTESGRVWGQRESSDQWGRRSPKNYPVEGTVVSWLDCRRPLDTVRVTLCHSTAFVQIPLAAITFTYAKSDEQQTEASMSVGAEVFSPPLDTKGENGHHWCWCQMGSSRKEELQAKPHYVHEIWRVGGQGLRGYNIWLSEEGILVGMQFIAVDGSPSPKWGSCKGDPAGKIDFAIGEVKAEGGSSKAGGPPAAGIKFYMGDNERHTSRDDSIVVAVQALVETETQP